MGCRLTWWVVGRWRQKVWAKKGRDEGGSVIAEEDRAILINTVSDESVAARDHGSSEQASMGNTACEQT